MEEAGTDVKHWIVHASEVPNKEFVTRTNQHHTTSKKLSTATRQVIDHERVIHVLFLSIKLQITSCIEFLKGCGLRQVTIINSD
jgi:hypothetical protein